MSTALCGIRTLCEFLVSAFLLPFGILSMVCRFIRSTLSNTIKTQHKFLCVMDLSGKGKKKMYLQILFSIRQQPIMVDVDLKYDLSMTSCCVTSRSSLRRRGSSRARGGCALGHHRAAWARPPAWSTPPAPDECWWSGRQHGARSPWWSPGDVWSQWSPACTWTKTRSPAWIVSGNAVFYNAKRPILSLVVTNLVQQGIRDGASNEKVSLDFLPSPFAPCFFVGSDAPLHGLLGLGEGKKRKREEKVEKEHSERSAYNSKKSKKINNPIAVQRGPTHWMPLGGIQTSQHSPKYDSQVSPRPGK